MVKNSKRDLIWYVLLLLIAAAWVAGLFIDLTGDSGLYAAISRQMVESGDWLNLAINGRPYDQKPHLLFWLSSVGIWLFGNYNFAYKLFPFLAAISGIYFTYRFARLLYSETAGRLAALMTGTSLIFFLYMHDIHTDSVLQAAVTLALWQLTAYLKTSKPAPFILSFAAIGFAMLTKGPVGAFVPFLYVVIFLIINRDIRQFWQPKWIAGVLIALIVASPALIHLYRNFGFDGLKFYFIDNNLGRITGKVAGSGIDPLYYFYNLLWALLPWTVPVFLTLIIELKNLKQKEFRKSLHFSLFLSIIITFCILSFSKGRAPNYMFLMIPSIFVLASGKFAEAVDSRNLFLNSQKFMVGVMVLIFLFSILVDGFRKPWVPGILLFSAILMASWIRKTIKHPEIKILSISVLMAALVNGFLNIQVLPHLFSYQGARQALEIYENSPTENGMLKNLHLDEFELFFWAKKPVEDFSTWENFYEFLKTDNSWVYTDSLGLDVVRQLTPSTDTVYAIPQAQMNRVKLRFLIPSSRSVALKDNYLIKIR